jgi:hypothetical protein
MALESIKKSTPFIKAALLKEGQIIKGYYAGDWTSEMYPERKNIKVKLSEPQTFTVHKKIDDDTNEEVEMSLKKGDSIILQGAGSLKYFFEEEHPLGCYFHFIYKGMVKIQKGPAKGKNMHRFDVLRDLDKVDAELGNVVSKESDSEEDELGF